MRKLLVILLNGGDIAWSVIIPEAGLQMQLSSITIELNSILVLMTYFGNSTPARAICSIRWIQIYLQYPYIQLETGKLTFISILTDRHCN